MLDQSEKIFEDIVEIKFCRLDENELWVRVTIDNKSVAYGLSSDSEIKLEKIRED